MASTYAGLTAPGVDQELPGLADRVVLARGASPGTLIWDRVRTSLMDSPGSGRPAGTVSLVPAGRAGSTRGRGALRVGGLQLLDDRVVLRAVHEVVDRDVLRRRATSSAPVASGPGASRSGRRRRSGSRSPRSDGDVGEPGLLDLVAEHRGAHRAGPHAGVAREDDVVDRLPARLRPRAPPRRAQPAPRAALLALLSASSSRRPSSSCPSAPPSPRSPRPGRSRPCCGPVRSSSEQMRNDVVAASSTESDRPRRSCRRASARAPR